MVSATCSTGEAAKLSRSTDFLANATRSFENHTDYKPVVVSAYAPKEVIASSTITVRVVLLSRPSILDTIGTAYAIVRVAGMEAESCSTRASRSSTSKVAQSWFQSKLLVESMQVSLPTLVSTLSMVV